jgi:hypothetical protein
VTRFEAEETLASRAMLERMGVAAVEGTGATARDMSAAGGGGICFACGCCGLGVTREEDCCSKRAFAEGECASERALVGGDCTIDLAFAGGERTSDRVEAVVVTAAAGAGAGAGDFASDRTLLRGERAGMVCATTSSGSRLLKWTLEDEAELVETIVVVTVFTGGIWAPPPEIETKLRAWKGSNAARAAAASAALRAAAAGESGGEVVHGGEG